MGSLIWKGRGGLHERHAVATWSTGNLLSICLQTQGNQAKPVPRWTVSGPSGCWHKASCPATTRGKNIPAEEMQSLLLECIMKEAEMRCPLSKNKQRGLKLLAFLQTQQISCWKSRQEINSVVLKKMFKDCVTFSCGWWELKTSHTLRNLLFLFDVKARTQLTVRLLELRHM